MHLEYKTTAVVYTKKKVKITRFAFLLHNSKICATVQVTILIQKFLYRSIFFSIQTSSTIKKCFVSTYTVNQKKNVRISYNWTN